MPNSVFLCSAILFINNVQEIQIVLPKEQLINHPGKPNVSP